MAISPNSYSLPSVMKSAWDDAALNASQKSLIAACLPNGNDRPTSEEQLATLQDTVSACEVLLGVRGTGKGHWLSQEGQRFPEAVHKFSYLVARRMHLAEHGEGDLKGTKCILPNDFAAALSSAIRRSNSHVATLNYDGLLSSLLSTENILGGSDAILRDGFVDLKFDRQNLFRKNRAGGWYLHLHGSPLFADREKAKPYKLADASLVSSIKILKNVGRHIVLTHFKHKPKIIETSEILSTYWEFLDLAIDESDGIVLFGYSGNDLHLNRLIAQQRSQKHVLVVEWLGAGNKALRGRFWAEQLGGAVELKLLEDVLTFSEWD